MTKLHLERFRKGAVIQNNSPNPYDESDETNEEKVTNVRKNKYAPQNEKEDETGLSEDYSPHTENENVETYVNDTYSEYNPEEQTRHVLIQTTSKTYSPSVTVYGNDVITNYAKAYLKFLSGILNSTMEDKDE